MLKVPELGAQSFPIEVARDGDVEASGLERLGDEACVIGRSSEGTRLVGDATKAMRFSARNGEATAHEMNMKQESSSFETVFMVVQPPEAAIFGRILRYGC